MDKREQIIYRTVKIEDEEINLWLERMSEIKSFKAISLSSVRGYYQHIILYSIKLKDSLVKI